MVNTQLKQLIPGNPGTSFVVALLYALKQKYKVEIKNNDQLTLFSKGIVNSRNVFFSGVINEIAAHFNKKITFLSNSAFILKLARPELNKVEIKAEQSILDKAVLDKLIETNGYVVFSVDIYQFKGYHDYHFVCISKESGVYKIFEPKSGDVFEKDKSEIVELISSITLGLKDILMCFVV